FRVDGLLNRAVTQGQNSTDADAAAMSVYAGQIGASGDIQARAGSIALVEVLGNSSRGLNGDLLGDVTATSATNGGFIGDIIVAGDVGTSSAPVSIRARAASGGVHVNSVAAQNFYGSIAHQDPSVDYVNVESLAIDGDVGPSGSQLWLSDFGTLTVG